MRSLGLIITKFTNTVTNWNFLNRIRTQKNQLLDWAELHPWKTLVVLYFIFVGIKILVSQINIDPSNLRDGYVYTKMARSFFDKGVFSIYGEPTFQYPPLYPISISPAFVFDDTISIFRMIRILSAIYSTLIIFPSFLLAREFLKSKNSLFFICIVSILPCVVIWVFNAVSECLFFTLFLFTTFFLYKALLEKSYKYICLSGFFIGISFLTRYTAIVFVPVILLSFVIVSLYDKKSSIFNKLFNIFRNCFILLCVSGIVVLPWLIRNGLLFGFTMKGIAGQIYYREIDKFGKISTQIIEPGGQSGLGSQYQSNIIVDFLTQFLINHAIIILACGILFLIMAFWLSHYSFHNKEKRICIMILMTFLLAESLIILTTVHNLGYGTWRFHGRYTEPVYPLIILMGFIGFTKIKSFRQKFFYWTLSLALPVMLLLTYTWGFMGGMISASYIGVLKNLPVYFNKFLEVEISSNFFGNSQVLVALLIIGLFVLFFALFRFNVSKKKVFAVACLIIFGSTIIGIGGYNMRDALSSRSDLFDCGNQLDSMFSGSDNTIYFDDDLGSGNMLLGIWINSPIIVRDWNDDINCSNCKYLISNMPYNYTILYHKNVSSPLGSDISGRPSWKDIIFVYNLQK